MSVKLYIGDASGIARQVKKLYVGDTNGIARGVKALYIGDSAGTARKVFGEFGTAPADQLPAGYTKVEYIQNGTTSNSAGMPYIQMPAKSAATKFSIKFSSEQSAPANGNIIYTMYGYCSYSSRYYFYGLGLYQGAVCKLSGTAQNKLIDYSPNTIYEVVFDSVTKTMTANGVTTSEAPGTSWRSNQNRVFVIGGDAWDDPAKATKVYSIRMWGADGDPVLDLVPCLDPSGEIGMYDTVDGVFYANSNTSTISYNKFIAGPPV